MSPEQEQKAEKIIEEHKKNNGMLNWNELEVDCDENQKIIIKKQLLAKGLINVHQGPETFLTDIAWTFSTFAKEKETENREKLQASEKEKYDLLAKRFVYRTRYLPFIFSTLALIVSIFVYLKKSDKDRYFPAPEQTRSPHVDSFRKSSHQSDTLLLKK